MKKIFITSIFALALILGSAAVANAAFTTYLTVGSTGADVTALQTWLISNGFGISAISSGAASKGYFGQQTKAAVVKYQASVGLPATGFVGPLTIAKLNGTAGSVTMTPVTCPIGYTCVPQAGTPTVPAGTPAQPGVISTRGVVGSLTYSLWSTPSGVSAYKGNSYDVVGYKAQASASDMAIQNLTVDFDVRLWLYASAVTLKDDTGAIVGQVNNLNYSNFAELSSTQFRLSIPVNNYVVKATQTRYLTLNVTFLPSSDRSTGTVTVLGSTVRSIDGTGVSDTQTASGGTRTFTYNGSGAGSVIVTTDPASPSAGPVQISTSGQTNDVVLAKYQLKSQNAASTLRSLTIAVQATNLAGITPTSLFGSVRLQIGGQTYSANTTTSGSGVGGIASTTYAFTNLTVPLAADQYIPLTILANVNVDTSGTTLSGATASTTIIAAGTNGGTSNNPVVEDASYSTVDVNEATFASNSLTFTSSSVVASNLGVTYGTAINNSTTGSSTQQFTYTFSLTAGNNPIYVSKISPTALATTTADPSGMYVSRVSFYDNDTSGDSSGTAATDYFYIAPGQTKSFTAVYSATGLTSNGGTITISSIKYGVTSSALTANSLNQPTISNTLKAILYH